MRIIFLLLFISCGKPIKEVCTPEQCLKNQGVSKKCNNLGHRLGGDMQHIADNRLASIPKAVKYEDHKCFKLWEFDARSAKDKLIVFHDKRINKDGPRVETLLAKDVNPKEYPRDVLDSLYRLPNRKPVGVDTKVILPKHEDEYLELIKEFINKGMKIRFRGHCSRKDERIFKRIIKEGLPLTLYRCKDGGLLRYN